MLRKILSITGRPGLYEIISQGKNSLIVEDLVSKKRLPVHARDKVVSLGDIAMYTESGDTPLGEILDRVYASENGDRIDVKGLAAEGKLRDKFGSIVADFDRERVYDSDIKKLFVWYNLLRDAGMEKFTKEEEETTETKAEKED